MGHGISAFWADCTEGKKMIIYHFNSEEAKFQFGINIWQLTLPSIFKINTSNWANFGKNIYTTLCVFTDPVFAAIINQDK